MPNFNPYTYVLIIRVWDESPSGSEQPSVWRCMVEDVESKESFYFSSSDKLLAFLKGKIGDEESG
jgi:hypothetical protein